jgi:tRNA A-37 threonylcarbamoyl transferase component Bud32
VALVTADANLAASFGAGAWCYKSLVSHSWWVRLASQVASLRTINAFHQGLLMRQAGILTPQPLAIVTIGRGRTYREYLLSEAVPGATSVRDWLTQDRDRTPDVKFWKHRRRMARDLGLQLQQIHAARFDHRDLKPSNILLCDSQRLWVIDLDGVWRWPVLPRDRRVQNLARLWAGVAELPHVTTTDALRFLLTYLGPDHRGDWKLLWKLISRRARRKISSKRNRALPEII